jgi:hypothetical protein
VPFGIIQHAGYYYDHDNAFISITIVQPCRARSAKPVVAKLVTSLDHAARRLALLPPRLAYCILQLRLHHASCIIRMLMLIYSFAVVFCISMLHAAVATAPNTNPRNGRSQ